MDVSQVTPLPLRLTLVLIAFVVGFYEWVQIVDLLSDWRGNVNLVDAYLDMDLAPSADQWRELDIRGLAKISIVAASAVHFLVGSLLLSGAVMLLGSKQIRRRATELVVLGLMVGVAYQLFSFLLMGSWLRISTTAAATHAVLYIALALLFSFQAKVQASLD